MMVLMMIMMKTTMMTMMNMMNICIRHDLESSMIRKGMLSLSVAFADVLVNDLHGRCTDEWPNDLEL